MDQNKQSIANSAEQLASYISNICPQHEGNKINYYLSGSLGMLLLCKAKTIKLQLVDHQGRIIRETSDIEISNTSIEEYSKGIRQMSGDIDIFAITDKTPDNTPGVLSISAIQQNCDASVLFKKGMGYSDILSDERTNEQYNTATLTMENGKSIIISSPIDLIIHKLADTIMSLNKIENGKNIEKFIAKSDKCLQDFVCLLNGTQPLINSLNIDLPQYIDNMYKISTGTALNKCLNYDNFNNLIDTFIDKTLQSSNSINQELLLTICDILRHIHLNIIDNPSA